MTGHPTPRQMKMHDEALAECNARGVIQDADATVIITTYNRKNELGAAIESALSQRGAKVEVLVIDDNSPDNTGALVREQFPAARLYASPENTGYIVNRNRGAALASGRIVVSIDDDAIFPSQDSVAQTIAEFDHPRIGAVAMPYVDVNYGPNVRQCAPDDGFWIMDAFRGTAHALRRDVFNRLSGYRPELKHQAEEGDYCLRMLDRGYVVRMGSADPLHHLESPNRSRSKIYKQTARNSILFTWHNVPMPAFMVHLAGATAKQIIDGVRHPPRLIPRLTGLRRGYAAIVSGQADRRDPVAHDAYALNRRLRKGGPVRFDAIEAELPKLRQV